jgi:hypothetical protein
MGEVPKPLTGRCLCGAVTYSADAEPMAQGGCHCEDCQRQSGSPFSVFIAVPLDSFTVEGDTLASFATTGTDHGEETVRHFCSGCGSPIYSASPLLPNVALIKAGSLDDSSWITPQLEVWTSSGQPWAPQLGAATAMERGPG